VAEAHGSMFEILFEGGLIWLVVYGLLDPESAAPDVYVPVKRFGDRVDALSFWKGSCSYQPYASACDFDHWYPPIDNNISPIPSILLWLSVIYMDLLYSLRF
jgi:hypothetical protein